MEKYNKLGFGVMRLPKTKTLQIDKEKVFEMFDFCLENNTRYFDTAWFYHGGNSEKIIGEYLKLRNNRDEMIIATKLPSMLVKTTEDMDKFFSKQLERLGVEVIDYYLLHAIDYNVFSRLVDIGVIEFMNNLKASGQIKKMGFSFHGPRPDIKKIIDAYDFDFVQLQYNILDTEVEEDIDYAASKNMEVIIMEPLRGGVLASEDLKSVKNIYHEINSNSVASWHLSYVFNNPNVSVVLSGMNDIEQLKDNLATCNRVAENNLNEVEISAIKSVKNIFQEKMRVDCTGCSYCLPCPVNIDIPSQLKTLNNKSLFGKRAALAFHAVSIGIKPTNGKINYASSCIECGKCERSCPQDIEIISALKDVDKEIETRLVKSVYGVVNLFTKNK